MNFIKSNPIPIIVTSIVGIALLALGARLFLGKRSDHQSEASIERLVGQIQPETPYREFFELENLAQSGDPKARAILVGEYLRGDLVAADKEKAIRLVKSAAKTLHPLALYFHQSLVDIGAIEKPFLTDSSKAEWAEIRRRCEIFRGEPEIQEILVRIIEQGLGGFEPDENQAYQYAVLAAQQNLPQAWLRRGYFHEHGKGQAEWNEELAFECYLKAARYGSADGNHHLARCYFEGVGTKKNYTLGLGYLARAAKKKGGAAQADLDRLLERGLETLLEHQDTTLLGISLTSTDPYQHKVGDLVKINRFQNSASLSGKVINRRNGKYLVSVTNITGVTHITACVCSGQIDLDATTVGQQIWVPQFCLLGSEGENQ